MARSDPTVEYSKKLCEDSGNLRASAKTTVTESKNAIARSRRLRAQLQNRQKTKKAG
jgi:hypothetical protein